jgi:hypothetical protein
MRAFVQQATEVKFTVFTATIMKLILFQNVTSCRLVEVIGVSEESATSP